MNKLNLILVAFAILTGFDYLNSMDIDTNFTTNTLSDYFGSTFYQPLDKEIFEGILNLNKEADDIHQNMRERLEEQNCLFVSEASKSAPINYLQILYNAMSDQIINSIDNLKKKFDAFLTKYEKQITYSQKNTPKGKDLTYLKWPQSMQLVNNFIDNGFRYKESLINNSISTHCMYCEECKAVCNWFNEGDVPNYYHKQSCKNFSESENAHIEQRIYFLINNNYLDGLVNFRKNSQIEQSIKTALDAVNVPTELINIIAQYADDFIEKWKTFIEIYADIKRIRAIVNVDTSCGFKVFDFGPIFLKMGASF